jgi:hypothetical protein
MQSRVAKIETLSVPAAEAARAVGLRTAKEFRENFVVPGLVKRLRVKAELYAVEAIKRAVALAADEPSVSSEPTAGANWLEKRALERLAQ